MASALGALTAVAVAVPVAAIGPKAHTSAGRTVTLTAQVTGVERSVPDSYLGFSVEWTELPGFEANMGAFARLLGLLSVAGQPVPFRLGGDTADSTYVPQTGQRVPRDGYVLKGDYFTQLGQLARATRLGLLFDVNLAARSPQMAQTLSRKLQQTVPRSSVTGIQVGNEPDLYKIGVIGNRFIKGNTRSPFQWALHYDASAYAADFARYVSALQPAWPHVQYGGPEVISGRTDFAHHALSTGKLSMLTVHRYEFNACRGPSGPTYPSLKKYLSVAASRTFAAKTEPLVTIAHSASVPLRVTEFGSAICGGRAGLTNTYATALWVANTIFNLMAEGVDGVNVHLREAYPNSALNASTDGITANPLYYGMLLVTKTLGPGAQLLNVTTTPSTSNVAVWAVRDRQHTTRVLLLNESGQSIRTTLTPGTTGQGTIQRLTAPAPTATTNIQFAGQTLTPTGNWTGTPNTEPAPNTHGTFPINLSPYSAALLTVAP